MDSSSQSTGSGEEATPPPGPSSGEDLDRQVEAPRRRRRTERDLADTMQLLEENVVVLMTKELKRLWVRLESENPEPEDEGVDEETKSIRKAFLGMTVEYLREMNENAIADRLLTIQPK